MVIQLTLLLTVQLQAAAVFTSKEPGSDEAACVADVADNEYVHCCICPCCVTTKSWLLPCPATVIVPVRGVEFGLEATE
jgi:hypothetical protein